MNFSLKKQDLLTYTLDQINTFFPDDKEIKTLVKYKVKPIGIRTITPVKK